MLQLDSPLRRLPRDIDPKHAFYLDGLRHAAEIASLAWERLLDTLTGMADAARREEAAEALHAAAFLDAWCIVDALDRFRTLWKKAPFGPTEVGDLTFWDLTEDLRKVRNVGDHPTELADHILSADTGALGTLHWLTLDEFDPAAGSVCILRPGFLPSVQLDFGDLSALKVDATHRTGAVRLKAGRHTANLSETMAHLEARVDHLEESLAAQFLETAETERATSDLLACATFRAPSTP